MQTLFVLAGCWRYGTLAVLVLSGSGPGWARRAATALLVAVGLGIAWSRLYLSVHWPSDVLAGALVATFWVAVCSLARHRLERRRSVPTAPHESGSG